MDITNADEVNLNQLVDEYLDLSARGVTMDQFLTYLETDHSELLSSAFKSRIMTDDLGNRVL